MAVDFCNMGKNSSSSSSRQTHCRRLGPRSLTERDLTDADQEQTLRERPPSTNMSVDFANSSHPPSNSSPPPATSSCSGSAGTYTLLTFASAYILLVLPLWASVLYLGSQRWRRRRSACAAAVASHSDFFTYNMAAVELSAVFGYAFYYCGRYMDRPLLLRVGGFIGSSVWFGQVLFPVLTCVERYLAVVHPVTYLGLRQAGGVRIRNITTGCVWLLCLGGGGFMRLLSNLDCNILITTSTLTLSLAVMTFCSLSVLRVLIRPRPGKPGGDRVQVDQTKQRAIHTIVTIMGVLWFKFGGNVVSIVLRLTAASDGVRCLGETSSFVFSLPGSVVLFLLFLHRAGKLPKCRQQP